MNMKPLSVVTPLSIYHDFCTQKTLWEDKFAGEEKVTLGTFTDVNMKTCGHRNVMKHVDIKGRDKHINLDISLKFGSLKKMRITPSEPKYYLGRLVKGLITSMGC